MQAGIRKGASLNPSWENQQRRNRETRGTLICAQGALEWSTWSNVTSQWTTVEDCGWTQQLPAVNASDCMTIKIEKKGNLQAQLFSHKMFFKKRTNAETDPIINATLSSCSLLSLRAQFTHWSNKQNSSIKTPHQSLWANRVIHLNDMLWWLLWQTHECHLMQPCEHCPIQM